ncbi:sensor domain-containing protein [Mycobacterium sp. HM-7]
MTKFSVTRCAPMVLAFGAVVTLLASCSESVGGEPTAAPQAGTSSATTVAPPPGADLQRVVLPVDELRRLMNDPTLVKTATWRHAGVGLSITFTPPQCGVVATNGLHAALDGSGQTGVYYVNYISTASPMVQVSAGAVGFPDAGAARAWVGAQQAVWQQCANIDVGLTVAGQSGTQHTSALQVNGDALSLQAAVAGGGPQCTRTMAARDRVVVDNLVCSADPAGAATAIANGMLDRIPR